MTNHIPKAKFLTSPFVEGYTSIEHDLLNYTIGNSEKYENLFQEEADCPTYITCLCNIVPKVEFNSNVEVSVISDENAMKFNLYSNEMINLQGFVSSLDIVCYDVLCNVQFPEDWRNLIEENCKIFTKEFITRKSKMAIKMFPDEDGGFKSKAYFFAGSYYKGIGPLDIQQYMFFAGQDVYGEVYANIISSKELLNSKAILSSEEITLAKLSTFCDDIVTGGIVLNFPNDIQYKSISMKKDALISDKCIIIFKKTK